MTLAVIVLLIHLPWNAAWADRAYLSGAPTPTAQDQGTVPQQTPPADAKQSPSAATPATPAKPPAAQPQPAKKPVHKKKSTAAGCESATPSGSNTATGASTNAGNATAGSTAGQGSGNPSPPKNCPPSKIVVSHGGSTEPSIQLAGGAGGDDASKKRDATTQMLGITENNLRKLSGQQLSKTQQDSVTQIRQYMEQSKGALASGDNERARTLAWKAETLSEDLVKPEK